MANQSDDMFKRVTDNAVDFLAQSLAELEKSPKYSVINFCSAIELFLKAKLMLEHWALIVDEPAQASHGRFISGNFKSVSMEESIERLQNIANVRIPAEGQRSFSEVRKHRNKMVHFFHHDYTEATNETIKAWFYLHKLLTRDWKSDFDSYQSRIAELHELVSDNRNYLQTKYNALLPGIEKGKQRGIVLSRCKFCGFEAVTRKTLLANLESAVCLVCESTSNYLRETCPDCGQSVFIYDLGEAFCENCDKTLGLEYFLNKYAPITHIEKDIFEENRAYCSYCEFTDDASVVPFQDQWLCLSCLQLHSEVGDCGWCSTFIAGDTEDTYVYGCKIWCDGYLGHHSDD
jgi:hypothetical protein